VGKPEVEVLDLEDDMDALVSVPVGMKRVYAVPRAFNCRSERFIQMMNMFGNLGGFDTIVDILENDEMTDKEDGLNVSIMGCLA
jgi:ubiquitin carboxyl-terminal hydrolase 34